MGKHSYNIHQTYEWNMLGYCGVALLMMAAMPGSSWGQAATEDPEGTQDGPCPNVGFRRSLNWNRLRGTWNEQLRMFSDRQPNQCPTSNTYGGTPPNITVTLGVTLLDGSVLNIPREGVIGNNPNQRLFSNPEPSPGFPNPAGILFETLYTNYRNIHVFWTCENLAVNKNIHYVWIESRGRYVPRRKLHRVVKMLAYKGIDVSRLWKVDMNLCTE